MFLFQTTFPLLKFQQKNNTPLWGENDRGSYHHSTSSSFHPQDVFNAPRLLTIDLCFIVFIFHSEAIQNEITVLQGCLIEKLRLPVICGSSLPSPEAVGPTVGGSCSLWHPTSHAKGRPILAVGRSHHSLMTRLLWCPLDGMSVTHGGKSISHV